MKRWVKIEAALALSALIVCACSGMPPGQDLVYWPEVSAGDCWTYRRVNYLTQATRDTYELCATFSDARAIHSVARFQGLSEDTDWTWTADWNPVTFPDGVQQTEAGLLQFPLKSGHEYLAAWTEETLRMGLRARHRRSVVVWGWEDVIVPAGTFRALRLEATGDYSRTWAGIETQDSGPARTTIWYVPAVKRWVKRVDETGRSLQAGMKMQPSTIGEELVTFKVR